MNNYEPADFSGARTYSVHDRPTKVRDEDFFQLADTDPTLTQFLDSLPHILKADDLRAVVTAIVRAKALDKPVIVGMGGHVIKCGLAPLFVHLMETDIISGVLMNGGASIHDFEFAMFGRSSEDVASSLKTGMWGMVRETGESMNAAIRAGAEQNWGMGKALGAYLTANAATFSAHSLLVNGVRTGTPVLVHIGIGADTIHMHASADGASLGKTSFTDFRILVSLLMELGDGGVYLNIGSAVQLPEVFVKALNLARNLSGKPIVDFVTVNMDMLQHYRPLENVVRRPTQGDSGHGYSLTGHHEIMVPLLFQLVLAKIEQDRLG